MRFTLRSARSPTVVTRRSAVAIVAVLSTLLLLTACSKPGAPAVVTVNGRVIDFFAPIANANVLVGGKVTTTAADGTFTVAGVHTPYDVILSFPNNTDVWVYRRLTRADPTLQIFGVTTKDQATISGSVGTAPYQTNEIGAVFAGGPSLSYGAALVQSGTTTFGPGTINWGPADPLHVTLYGIRVVMDSSGHLTGFTGYGSLAVTLHKGDALTGLAIPTNPVSTASLSGMLVAPAGYSISKSGVVLRFGPSSGGVIIGLPLTTTPSGSFSNAVVPVATGITYGLGAQAQDGAGDAVLAWSAVTAPSTSAKLTLPSVPQPTAPAPNATNVAPGTTFRWTPLAGSIYVVSLMPNGATGPHVYIVTDSSSTTLPDLSVINRSLPTNASYDFNVQALGTFSSMNASAATGMYTPYVEISILFYGGGGSGPQGASGPDQPSWFTTSKVTSFTTAP